MRGGDRQGAGDKSVARVAFLVNARVDMSPPQSRRGEMGVAFLVTGPTGSVTSWMEVGWEIRRYGFWEGHPGCQLKKQGW